MPLLFSPVEVEYLASGKRLSRTSNNLTPLSPKQFWSAFDDYLTVQQALSGHPDVVLETDNGKPANGVGATIRFDYKGMLTRETLVVYDKDKHIWKINLPEPNSVFSFYEATARVYPASDGGDGSEVTLTIDFSLQGKNAEERTNILHIMANSSQPQRIEELNTFVLERDGLRCSFEIDVHCPSDKLWAVIGNWEDVSWVQYATDVRMIPIDGRKVFFPHNNIVEERLVYASDADRELVYEVSKSAMDVSLYRGTVKLEPVDANVTKVKYNNVFLPKDRKDSHQVQAQIEKTFKDRFKWFQAQFDARVKV
jgi:arachidonate 15-lipoxygenase